MRFKCLETLARQVQDMCEPIVRTKRLHDDVSGPSNEDSIPYKEFVGYDKSRSRIFLK